MKTTDIKTRRETEIITPKELIEMHELVSLDLQDRRIYRLLVKNAWDEIDEDKTHCIEKKLLRQGMGGDKQRLGESIERIMGVILRRPFGRRGMERFQLLGHNADEDEDSDDTKFYYTFPKPLRSIIRKSEVWARLESHVIYAFSSKYALALYEIVSLRANLKHKNVDTFEISTFRKLLGVEDGKLTEFKNLKTRAIDFAVREVNGLCPDFNVAVDPVLTGRKVTAIKITWWPKEKTEKAAALREMNGSRLGRKERLTGTAEAIVAATPALDQPKRFVAAETTEQERHRRAKEKLKGLHPGADVEAIYTAFNRAIWSGQHPEPKNFEAAFITFGRKLAREAGV